MRNKKWSEIDVLYTLGIILAISGCYDGSSRQIRVFLVFYITEHVYHWNDGSHIVGVGL